MKDFTQGKESKLIMKFALPMVVSSLFQNLYSIIDSIIVGNFNINWLIETVRRPLYNLLVRDKGYKQLISTLTTDNKIAIDYIYTFTYPTWMSKQVFWKHILQTIKQFGLHFMTLWIKLLFHYSFHHKEKHEKYDTMLSAKP